ncbi:MAG: glycosyltransferase [Methanobrevibacter sp.]|jgi:glycosyltransferase involved in cell wall biosynthesis|nr:glycosyltransferase [Candidatus Methanoflexus mossambicus]
MTNETKISVIIPVYNAEKYLEKCLDSVVNQTLENIEIICVNDGSTDSSIDILNKYSKKDPRFIIIDQKNKGGAPSRYEGLKIASGDYVFFLDNDDWITTDALEKIYNNAISNDSDLVIFKSVDYYTTKDSYDYSKGYNHEHYFDKETNFNDFIFTHEQIKPKVLNSKVVAWNKLYKKEFLNNFDDFYFDNLMYADVPFHVQVLLRADRISFCPEYLNFYRKGHPEATMSYTFKTRESFDILKIIDEVESFLNNNNFMKEYKQEFFIFSIYPLNVWLELVHRDFQDSFFEKSKNKLLSLKLSSKDLEELPINISNIYKNIVNSDSFEEMQLNIIKEEYNIKLNNQRRKYEKSINKQKKLLKEIKDSNSWKITKPLRKIRNLFNK